MHPDNELAQALYGRCLNERPYFVSAGPDGLFGTTDEIKRVCRTSASSGASPEEVERAIAALEDNIYSYEVGPARIDPDDAFNVDVR